MGLLKLFVLPLLPLPPSWTVRKRLACRLLENVHALPLSQVLADRTTHGEIPSFFARLRRNVVLHVNCLYNSSFYRQAPGDEAGTCMLFSLN